MKERWKAKRLLWIMLLAVIFSVAATVIVLAGFIDDAEGKEGRYWFFEEAIQTGKAVTLENAYVYSGNDGRMNFLYEGSTYVIDGRLQEHIAEVADVVIEGERVAKVRRKKETQNGILHSYNEDKLTLMKEAEDASTVSGSKLEELPQNQELPIYIMEDDAVRQGDWADVIVGTSKIACVLEQNRICALVVEETLPSDIRVLIKNGSELFFSELYVKTETDGKLTNVKEALAEQTSGMLELSDEKGLLLCNAKGEAKGTAYEGLFRVIGTDEGMVLVNELPIETYVKYVLPSEMPKRFHEEALKAQAVCARTFAYAHMANQSYAQYGANLDDSTSFQVYHTTGRNEETDAAVDATTGEYITCKDDLIVCYYFSTSGGMTNDMSVWNSNTPEYIAMRTSEDTESPFYRWTAYLDVNVKAETGVDTDKDANSDAKRGALKSVEIQSKNKAGYVTAINLIYEKETVPVTTENDIRRALGAYLTETKLHDGKTRTDLSMIPSANFTVASNSDGKVVLEGAGFGHGIGMSQYGANQMAKNGSDYKDIITYYYNDVEVVKE